MISSINTLSASTLLAIKYIGQILMRLNKIYSVMIKFRDFYQVDIYSADLFDRELTNLHKLPKLLDRMFCPEILDNTFRVKNVFSSFSKSDEFSLWKIQEVLNERAVPSLWGEL
jgi:hypothetical protein